MGRRNHPCADAKDGNVAVSGWQDVTAVPVLPFIQSHLQEGIQQVICTDIAKDGAMTGPSFELYNTLTTACNGLKLIASGGVTTLERPRKTTRTRASWRHYRKGDL